MRRVGILLKVDSSRGILLLVSGGFALEERENAAAHIVPNVGLGALVQGREVFVPRIALRKIKSSEKLDLLALNADTGSFDEAFEILDPDAGVAAV